MIWPLASSPCRKGSALPIACERAEQVSVPKSIANRMPVSDPPAIRPELKSVPALSSESDVSPVLRSTHHRTSAADEDRRGGGDRQVRADGERQRVDAAQLERDRDEHADQHQPHGSCWSSRPRMSVAISVACGAATCAEPMPNVSCRLQQRPADHERRGDDADGQPHLLIDRRGADDVAGLEILRRVAGVGRGDADDGADRQARPARRRCRSSRARRR